MKSHTKGVRKSTSGAEKHEISDHNLGRKKQITFGIFAMKELNTFSLLLIYIPRFPIPSNKLVMKFSSIQISQWKIL